MNPDLMITIAFSLWALLASGALGMLFVRSVRNQKTEEADDAKRLDPARDSAVAIRQPGPTRAAGELRLERSDGSRISTGASRRRAPPLAPW
jgi:hypothetical protein